MTTSIFTHRWLRFSLRSLIAVVMMSAMGFAWFCYEFRRAEGRRMAVERLRDFPGYVQYEDNPAVTRKSKAMATADQPSVVREWLTKHLGVDFCYDVDRVCLDGRRKFSDDDIASMCRLSQLKSLRLGKTVVTDEGIEAIAKLADLEQLSFSSPHITDRAMTHIARLSKLQRLSLFEVVVSDAGLAKLAALENLESLYLRRTQVTPSGVSALQTALPECEIIYKP